MTHITRQADRTDWQTERFENRLTGLRSDAPLSYQPRRRQVRFAVRPLQALSPVFGLAVEISAGGLRLESVSTLVTGAEYVFRLNYGTRFLNLPGRVIWCRLDRLERTRQGILHVYQTGVELRLDEPSRRWRAALADRAGVAIAV